MYIEDSGDADLAKYLIKCEAENGFVWMQRSVDFMKHFRSDREKYPTMRELMPQLAAFLQYTADNFDRVMDEYAYAHPYITGLFPAPGTDITSDREIVISFSEPMNGSYGFDIIPPSEGVEILWFDRVEWSDDYTSLRLTLTPGRRKPGHRYGLRLKPEAFQSERYLHLDESCKDVVFFAQ